MRLRKSILIVFLLSILAVHGAAEHLADGKWLIEMPIAQGIDKITLELKAIGEKLSGSMTRSIPAGIAPATIDGTVVDSTTIKFTLTAPNGRMVTFTGKVKADEIVFKREVKGTGGGDGILGEFGPESVTAKRAKN